ncbi:MAG: hypothetical protein CL928_11215, partial [Deltaproteobacteria bacterium]|nr:hypothetical protein [Deltaproteobacteria bacterium]
MLFALVRPGVLRLGACLLLFLVIHPSARAEQDDRPSEGSTDSTSDSPDDSRGDDKTSSSAPSSGSDGGPAEEDPQLETHLNPSEAPSGALATPEGQEVDSVASPPEAAIVEPPAASELSGAPLLGAVAEVRAALVRVDALSALLVVESLAEDRQSALVELSALRRSLEDSLLQLGREQGRADLAAWLQAEGLMLVAASTAAIDEDSDEAPSEELADESADAQDGLSEAEL